MPRVPEEEYTGPAMTAHDWMYVRVGAILAVLTAIEVGLYYLLKNGTIGSALNVWVLLGLAFSKFIIVAAYFMHLKFDSPVFRRMFGTGAVLALFCYTAVLHAFGVFRGSGHWYGWGAFLTGAIVVIILVTRKTTPELTTGAADGATPAH